MFGSRQFHPLFRNVTPGWRTWHAVLHETYYFDWPTQDVTYTAPGEWGMADTAVGTAVNGWEVGLAVTSVIVNIDISASNTVDLLVQDSSYNTVGSLTTGTLSPGSHELTIPVTLAGDDLLRVRLQVATGDNYITRLRAIASPPQCWTNHVKQSEA